MGMGRLDGNPGDVRQWRVRVWGIILGIGMNLSAGLGAILFGHVISHGPA